MTQSRIDVWAGFLLPMCAGIALMITPVSIRADTTNSPVIDGDSENQLGLTFSPDGSAAFWTAWNGDWGSSVPSHQVIFTSQLRDGEWTTPTTTEFTGDHSDSDPFVSPDGRWLYFVSDRPTDSGDELNDGNIWRNSLVDKEHLEYLSLNSDAEEYSPVVTASGALYFASSRSGGAGEGDLYRAAASEAGFQAPELLGAAFNTPTGEWNIWVSSDESEIIFEASSRKTNLSIPGDLYYSWHTPAGWTAAIPIKQLNSHNSDLMPRLHPDGETLYYTLAPIGGHAEIAAAKWAPLRTELRSSYAPTLMVANRSSHEVTFVDLALGVVVASVATGEGPHLLSNVSGDQVSTTGYGEFPRPHTAPVSNRPPFIVVPNSRLTLIDIRNRVTVLDARIEDCERPHASWIVESRAYVTCERKNRVVIIDLEDGRAIGHFETQQAGSHVLSFEPESKILAVSNVDSGSLTLINIESGFAKVVNLAAGSEGLAVIGSRFWVTNAVDGSVSVVDPGSAKLIEHISSVCGFPIALGRAASGHVWVACFATAELVAIDYENFTLQERIELADQPLNLLLHPTLDLAYVSLPRQNAIAEIDLASGKELRRLDVGIEPDGLRWALLDR